MNTEEKARRYDEALNWMREIYPGLHGATKEDAEHFSPELAESEEERIRTEIIDFIQWAEDRGMTRHDYHQAKRPAVWIAYLEKQRVEENYDRMQPIYDNLDSFESALAKAWKAYNDSGSRTVDGCEDDYVECAHAKGFREGYLFGLEKQKELPFVKDVVLGYPGHYFYDGERMHFCGNPAMEEKQKEQKPEHFELKAGYWYICHRAFCCRADHLTVKEGERFMCEKDGVVNGFVIKEPEKYFIECSAPAPMEDEQKEQKSHYTKRNALFDKCLENCDPEVRKEVSDNVDLSNAAYDYAHNHIVAGADFSEDYVKKQMEKSFISGAEWVKQKEQKPLTTEETELNSIAFLEQMGYTCIPPGKEQRLTESRKRNKPKESWLSKAKYEIEHADELLRQSQEELKEIRELKKQEQKPICDIASDDAIESCMLRYLQSAANRKDDIEIIEDTKAYKSELISIIKKEQKPAEWSEVELEFRGEKVKVKRPFFRDDNGRGYSTTEQDEEVAWYALRAWCEKKGISLYDLYPKEEWSEEDKQDFDDLIMRFEKSLRINRCYFTSYDVDWLKSKLNETSTDAK